MSVKIVGRPDLEGSTGIVVGYRATNDRYEVEIIGYGENAKIVSDLKISNLRMEVRAAFAKPWLYAAVFERDYDLVVYLAPHMTIADLNALDPTYGRTLLSTACWRGDAKIASFLLLQGVDPELATLATSVHDGNGGGNGMSPSHCACDAGHPDCLSLLIEYGIDINKATALMGMTLMHYAAGGGQNKVIALLLFHGAEINPLDKQVSVDAYVNFKPRDEVEKISRRECELITK
jgi:hypothetical protein